MQINTPYNTHRAALAVYGTAYTNAANHTFIFANLILSLAWQSLVNVHVSDVAKMAYTRKMSPNFIVDVVIIRTLQQHIYFRLDD